MQDATLAAYDRKIGLELDDLAVDGCMTMAPCGGEVAGRSPANRGSPGLKRSLIVDARGISRGNVIAPASRPDSPLLPPTLERRVAVVAFWLALAAIIIVRQLLRDGGAHYRWDSPSSRKP